MKRTANEAAAFALKQVDEWVLEGFSGHDACRIVAKIHDCDNDKLLDLWLDNRINDSLALRFEV